MVEEVDVRERWPSEAQDFTPWLAENLGLLGEEIGLKLEFVSMEEPVGPFSLDILARDVNSSALVAIENQLEWTDHTHLGQLLTYAAGCDANVAVWVTTWVGYEHGEAINRLNEWTGGKVEFYGIEVKVIKREGSPPEPRLHLVASPTRKYVKDYDQVEVSPRTLKLRDFFQSLRQKLWQTEFFEETPIKRNYYIGGTQGFASALEEDVWYQASLERVNDAWVSLYVGIEGNERTNRIFDALQEESEQIEASFNFIDNSKLEWLRRDGTGYSGIHIRTDCSIDDSPEKLEETRAWMIEYLIKFKAVFEPRLERILSEIPGDDRGE